MDFPVTTTERFIAYFDIMGFKDMIYRDGHEKVSKVMDEISSTVALIKGSELKSMSKGVGDSNKDLEEGFVLPVLFSDSILFVSQGNSQTDLRKTIWASIALLTSMFSSQIPIKGALAYGMFTADFKSSKFFGRPLVDAYLLAEEIHFYGALLHHSCELRMIEIKADKLLRSFHRNLMPLKGGLVNHYFVDWRIGLEVWNPTSSWESILQPLYMSVSGITRKYVDNSFKVHRENPPQ